MKIEKLKIEEIIPYARNPRVNAVSVDKVASSIKEFGFRQPLVLDEKYTILAGHTRLLASKKLGLKEVPVHIANGLSEGQKKAYRIMDNRSSEDSEWDEELLSLELMDLQDNEFDLGLTGFTPEELSALLSLNEMREGLTDEDAVPDLPEEPTTKLGDLWLLGKHRLLCGDSTSIDVVEQLMDGNKADLVFTDPPYGISYGGGRAAGTSAKGALVKAHGEILGDDKRGDELLDLLIGSIGSLKTFSKGGSPFYVCLNYKNYSLFEEALKQVGLSVTTCIVWDKKSIGLGRSNYRPQHEFIFYYKGDQWLGEKNENDVWYMSRVATVEYLHPTQKPVELIERAIKNSSKLEDLIADIFMGSGSTLIACEKLARKCFGIELDPKYCDVIVQRWEEFTGKKAKLDG